MSYLKNYGSKKGQRRFQEGGMAPAPAGPEQGGGGEGEQIMALAQAATQGDQQAAAELGMMLAPMILQEAQAQAQGGGGAPAPEAAPMEAEPQFSKGGVFLRKL